MENLAYQDPVWKELIDGKVVAMRSNITHSRIIGNIGCIFSNYLRGKKCTPFAGRIDLYLSEKDRVIPDMMVVCNSDIIKKDGVHGAPDLIVEVLSPSTAKRDRGYKKDLYERSGVKEYWIVDPMNKAIETYLLKNGKFVFDNLYSLYPDCDLKRMTSEEIAKIPTEFKCSLYDDLTMSIKKVFSKIF